MSHPLLTAPIGRSLLRLAAPTTGITLVQILVSLAEGYFVAKLGTDALAGFALVAPFIVLTFNVAVGGMGGAVTAALARALGAAQRDDARALVLHAVLVALVLGLLFHGARVVRGARRLCSHGRTRRRLAAGPDLQRHLVRCSARGLHLRLLCRSPVWRGRYRHPGAIRAHGFVPLCAAGRDPHPRNWRVARPRHGRWIASIAITFLALLLFARAIWRGRLGFMPGLRGVRLQARLFHEILRVGTPGMFRQHHRDRDRQSGDRPGGQLRGCRSGGLWHRHAPGIRAGCARLWDRLGRDDLVGVAAGANAWPRAVRAAWTGGLTAAVMIGALGCTAALLPETWSRLFMLWSWR